MQNGQMDRRCLFYPEPKKAKPLNEKRLALINKRERTGNFNYARLQLKT